MSLVTRAGAGRARVAGGEGARSVFGREAFTGPTLVSSPREVGPPAKGSGRRRSGKASPQDRTRPAPKPAKVPIERPEGISRTPTLEAGGVSSGYASRDDGGNRDAARAGALGPGGWPGRWSATTTRPRTSCRKRGLPGGAGRRGRRTGALVAGHGGAQRSPQPPARAGQPAAPADELAAAPGVSPSTRSWSSAWRCTGSWPRRSPALGDPSGRSCSCGTTKA
jgi:hypothetical protein